MKMKLPLIAALCCGLTSVGSAFTLNFQGLVGTEVGSTLQIEVPFYGFVEFTPVSDQSTLVVDNAHMNDDGTAAPSLSFDSGEQVQVTFVGNQPLNVNFDIVGENVGEELKFSATTDTNVFIGSFSAGSDSDGAGLFSISFNQVPEPSSALLGVIGSSLLILRRRR
ncbi:MAG: PEP-CTERM sorting domain-containing protein [Luteolibacter sp.]